MSTPRLDLEFRPTSDESALADLTLGLADGTDKRLLAGVSVMFDRAALLAQAADPLAYGQTLTAQLFTDRRLRNAWEAATIFSQGHDAPLRLRLRLEEGAEGWHSLRWETLQDPLSGRPLCQNENVLFSRYVQADDYRPLVSVGRGALRALVAVASPVDLAKFQLGDLDVLGHAGRGQAALAGLSKCTVLAAGAGEGPLTRERLWEALSDGAHIVYLVCHSRLVDDKPYLWLEDEGRRSDYVPGEMVASKIAALAPAKRPRLIMLAACQTAGDDDPHTAVGALGPMLVRAGAGAVIGMQGLAPVPLIEHLIPALFRRLLADEPIDRALATARADLPEGLPWWMPVLFMRVTDGRIWFAERDRSVSPRLPLQQPRVADTYVRRPGAEARLREALTVAQPPVVVLHGMSGLGKTSLATRVAHDLAKAGSFAGVLWGSLDHLTPNDLLRQFLGALEPSWYHRPFDRNLPLRDAFWDRIKAIGRPLLVVFDQVADAGQLAELLPSRPEQIGRSRVLALSVRRLAVPGLDALTTVLELGDLAPEEALELFAKLGTVDWATQHRVTLQSIAGQLEHVPQLLTLAAREMAAGTISPASYLQRLKEGRGDHRLLDGSVTTSLDAALHDLTPPQLELLEFTGVLGEGDWHFRMLAAVACRRPEELDPDLTRLVERDLIRQVRPHRYRVNTLVREFALQRLGRLSPYVRRSATSLLTHYCQGLAQDAFSLAETRGSVGAEGSGQEGISEPIVEAFREHMRPELSHLRRALHWAAEQQAWDLLLRFAYVPALELLAHLVVNRSEVRMMLTMASILEPVTRSTERPLSLDYGALIISADWSSVDTQRPDHAANGAAEPGETAEEPDQGAQRRCELIWNITAGHIIDGALTSTSLVDSSWKGVRAPRLVCREVDIVGSQLLACDLSQSVLFHCDARRVQMTGTVLQEALLVEVRLYGADLRGVNANGARLERVDLRGANLRDASLVGATLEDVDLRGADLRGANLARATLCRVQLQGCQFQGVNWAGTKLDAHSNPEDVALLQVIRAGQDAEYELLASSFSPRARPDTFSPDLQEQVVIAEEKDLRARRLRRVGFANARLSRADLHASVFDGENLEGVVAEAVSGRCTSFRGARLAHAKLGRADLRATDISRADLTGADLERATLRSALGWRATLHRADLRGADLRFADLERADLREARLCGADLSRANLAMAVLEGADLSGVNLSRADLRSARLLGARLDGAGGSHVNFKGAQIDNRQLATLNALGGAVLPEGQTVALFDGSYLNAPEAAGYHFTQWSGDFVGCMLRGRDLFGACLDGSFAKCDLDDAWLQQTHLTGNFANCTLRGARLAGARLRGIFYGVDLSRADLSDANLAGASFVNCILVDAIISDEQLRDAARLRGTQLSSGRYDGRWGLTGDREDARKAAIDPDNEESMRRDFYPKDEIRFKTL